MSLTSTDYKLNARLPRYMTMEEAFNFGMSYIDTPLEEGFSKLLVNYDLKNAGTGLAPRGGLKLVTPNLAGQLLAEDVPFAVHHIGSILVKSIAGDDATVHKYILISPVVPHPVTGLPCYYFNKLYCFIETDAGFLCTAVQTSWYSNVRTNLTSIHGAAMAGNADCNRGIFVSIDANTYIPVYNADGTTREFAQLALQFTSADTFSVALTKLEPKEVSAAQVINSGYNLMKANPYSFLNTQNVTGALVLNGVIPKDVNGNIKLTASVGEAILYYLNYTYPAADATKKYYVQWEAKDTTSSSETTVLRQVRKSPEYTPGDDIIYGYIVPYKQFTMVVKVYYKSAVDAHTYVSDDDDATSLAPIQVITVSSYYTTADVAGNAANLTPKTYDMTTCTGLCTWQQRTVMWGVKNAATTLFVSQPNLPEYVPYPNNVEIFSEDVVYAVPYLTYLLVFTKSRLHQLSLTSDGINTSYTNKCIQERLIMTEEDATTITVVKNMVYFKSGNYFYMVVPNSKAGTGELQLAPVTKPIESLLDNFTAAVSDIINEVYNISYSFGLKEGADDSYAVTIVDYTNYLDGSIMRNVYKCKVVITKAGVLFDTRYIDFMLNYDTLLRAWNIYLCEGTQHRISIYESTVTSGVIILTAKPVTSNGNPMYLQLTKMDMTSPKDDAPLTQDGKIRKFLNYQLIDTGYRSHFPAYLKRFREIQFSVNNTTQDQLEFITSFTVDDDARRALFSHEVQQITDPESPDYGLIYVERTLEDEIRVPGAIKLDTGWVLDFSKFPNITVSKVKYRVSGKGYLGKISILSRNETLYELLSVNWVYRKMNGR